MGFLHNHKTKLLKSILLSFSPESPFFRLIRYSTNATTLGKNLTLKVAFKHSITITVLGKVVGYWQKSAAKPTSSRLDRDDAAF